MNLPVFTLGVAPMTSAELLAVAFRKARVRLDPHPDYRERIARGAKAVRDRVEAGDRLYGVTTGFGDSCEVSVPPSYVEALPSHLFRFHGCGVGPYLSEAEGAAIVAARLASLAKGYSGVRIELLERFVELLEHRIVPRIPSLGSVGASGDLTPLSYVAAVLAGERDVYFRGGVVPAMEAFRASGLGGFAFAPKEALAVMNGTSVMTGVGLLAVARAKALARWAAALTATAAEVLSSNRSHFDPRIDQLKPHLGHRMAAAWIREDLELSRGNEGPSERLQDRYSIRCAPHVIGVLADAALWAESVLEIEANSVNDNPIVDPETGEFVNGGNFYGGHVAFVLDGLKTAIANVAGLLDRQLALLCSPATNAGLPANLVGRSGPDRAAHHGFKAMQITASALCAEAMKQTMPASVFSRSTECHNQDIVSMGTHAALDCVRNLDLVEWVAAISTLAVCQGVDLRGRAGCHARAQALHEAVRAEVPFLDADRAQDADIERVVRLHREGRLPIGVFA